VLYFVLRWCRSWRGRDVVITVLASLVMVGGMAGLVHHGAWVLAPLLLGCALCWRTPTCHGAETDIATTAAFAAPARATPPGSTTASTTNSSSARRDPHHNRPITLNSPAPAPTCGNAYDLTILTHPSLTIINSKGSG